MGNGVFDQDATLAEMKSQILSVVGPERFLDISWRAEGGLRVDVASDGLTLSDKAALESAVKKAIGTSDRRVETVLYFKRRSPASDGPRPKGPVPLTDRKAPFGLSIDKKAIPGVTEIIVVASGKGGVGKSTVSANLAAALASQGKKVGLLDADIYGPSAPMMLGVSGPMAVSGGTKLVPKEAHGVKVVSFGFLTDTQEPVIWRGPMIAKAFKQLAYDVAWGELDYLVVDLPPGTGDIQLVLIECLPIHGAIIVTTPQDVALLDAHKALSMFQRLEVPVLGLVENMSMFTCSRCGHEEHIFGEGGGERMALERGLKVLARLPLDSAVRSHADAGQPIALANGSKAAAQFGQLAKMVTG